MKSVADSSGQTNSLSQYMDDISKKGDKLKADFTSRVDNAKQNAISTAFSKAGVDEAKGKAYMEAAPAALASRPVFRKAITNASQSAQEAVNTAKSAANFNPSTASFTPKPEGAASEIADTSELPEAAGAGKNLMTGTDFAEGGEAAEGAAETGLLSSASVEAASGIGAGLAVATLVGVGLYDVFHKGNKDAQNPTQPVNVPAPKIPQISGSTIQQAKNSYTSPTFDSVVDLGGSAGAF